MAIHENIASMLKESLDETLDAAKYCVDYVKEEKILCGDFTTGGCLGFPGAILLFSIIDTIGSYFRGNKELSLMIDGKPERIKKDAWEHFKILNSKYFNQTLSKDFMHKLYKEFRSLLTHNSVLGKYAIMVPSNRHSIFPTNSKDPQAFFLNTAANGVLHYIISMKELYDICTVAVKKFKEDIDVVVPNSELAKVVHRS
jgi:hypothetical protein